MIKRLLIANRGEIARRIIRTCRRLGVGTVAVYSDADAQAPHVREADGAIRLGPAPARESYLRGDLVIAAAREAGADAIHPGYGFLSENADFAEAVVAAGLVWVGPPASSIRAMGLKDAAKSLMAAAGVPVTPGYLGEEQSDGRLRVEADRIGYPVLIKAVAGGGGKGMRRVDESAGFADALGAAKREAAAAFGDDRVLLETYVTRPRHIEVQVFADNHGNVVHLFERDCSLQRRHQKVIEEAPAPGMSEEARAAVTSAAVKAAQAVGYQGAGTVEFIADASEGLRGDRIFFMEMNTRLQVEHPVTEMITGQDLVEWQLRVAAGEPLPLRQDQLTITGHAMEARLYAENPATGFLPSTGRLEHFRLPDDPHFVSRWRDEVRVDSAVEQGGEVSVHYDPMIAKLITHSETREDAAGMLAEACRRVEVWPVKTNAAFLARCLAHPDFLAGELDTGFIPARQDDLVAGGGPSRAAVIAAAAASLDAERWRESDFFSPWSPASPAIGFRLNGPPRREVRVDGDGGPHSVRVLGGGGPEHNFGWRFEQDGAPALVSVANDRVLVDLVHGERPRDILFVGEAEELGLRRDGARTIVFQGGEAFSFGQPDFEHGAEAASDGAVIAPMPGRIVSVEAQAGQAVLKGAKLLTLEAMKMEHGLTAPFDGRVAEVNAAPGAQVSEGAVLVRLEADEA